MKKSILFTFVLSNLLFGISLAQWQAYHRLTNNSAGSYTSFNNAWCIAANGNNLHVAWFDERDGNFEIYYKRSTDGGTSWVSDIRLTNNTAVSSYPSVSVSGSVVHIVWSENRDGNYEIYYKRSTNGGVSWGTDTRMTNASSSSAYPSISISGSVVHIVWSENRDGNYEIYYKRSTNGGSSWGTDIRLTNNSASSTYPSVSVSGSAVHVIWTDYRDGNYEIYYKRSADGGISWGADTRLTNDPGYTNVASVSASGSVVHVVWDDNRDGNGEIYYKRSTNGGVSWGTDTRLTNGSNISWYPCVTVSGQYVHVVWNEYFNVTNPEIYYSQSSNGGTSWGTDIRLTINTAASLKPSVAVSGSAVHVVWQEERDGNPEIYYRSNPTGNPVGIINTNSEIPQEFFLSQNYPNPFNPATKIKFALPNRSFVTLVVYDMLGRVVSTLASEIMEAGYYTAEFDGTNLAGGVYFYRIIAGDFEMVKKLVLVK